MSATAKEQEYREEAERLALLSVEDQQAAIAIIREPASNPKLSKSDRSAARERADALERLLRPARRRRKKT